MNGHLRSERMDEAIEILTAVARRLTQRLSFEETLQEIAAGAASVLAVERVSVRLFDSEGSRLIAVARAGRPLHDKPQPFRVGEGLIGWIVQHAEPIRTGDALADPRFETREGMDDTLRSFVGVPMTSGAQCIGVLSAVADTLDYFDDRHQRLLTLLAAIAAPWVEVARLARLSTVDPLTGSLNRRGLDAVFPEVEGGDELIEPLSVVMVDLDHFKRLNDQHGHLAGDEVLRVVSERLASVLRRGDAVVRYGGEEFLLLLPKATGEHAVQVAGRARVALERVVVTIGGAELRVTASFGIAQRRGAEPRDGVIARADAALYRAKAAGRNCVVAAD